MKDTTLLLIGGIGIGVYFLWEKSKKRLAEGLETALEEIEVTNGKMPIIDKAKDALISVQDKFI